LTRTITVVNTAPTAGNITSASAGQSGTVPKISEINPNISDAEQAVSTLTVNSVV